MRTPSDHRPFQGWRGGCTEVIHHSRAWEKALKAASARGSVRGRQRFSGGLLEHGKLLEGRVSVVGVDHPERSACST
jgi:hypothetical protein